MSIINNTVGTTGITPVETEDTKSMKQESRDFSRGRFNECQEDEFWDDPYRVEKRVETVQIETWVPMK